ncbi:MAG: Holliday junction resolvase RuvX [Lachnospiraceae bacterium]|nr:Holliday junction resolvase RuvX [Lachnospiraceae bacterium]
MRKMGLDYGSKTVGVAMTDALGYTVMPFETITRKEENKLRRTLARIAELVGEYEVDEIVLGRPVLMDGSDGERVSQTVIFKELLEKRVEVPIVFMDERLTTVEADEALREMEIPRSERKKYIDQIAAVLVLRSYLNQQEYDKEKENLRREDEHGED